MSPEVAAVERKGGYNELCDVWALGITGEQGNFLLNDWCISRIGPKYTFTKKYCNMQIPHEFFSINEVAI